MDGAVLIWLTLGSKTLAGGSRLAGPFIVRCPPLLKRHYGMPIPAPSARMSEARGIHMGTGISWPYYVWYLTARLCLLRRKLPLPNSRESAPHPFSRDGGRNESI